MIIAVFMELGVGMAGRGVGMARIDNYCEIDPNVVDKFGIPVLRFHYKWNNDEINQAKHMQETFQGSCMPWVQLLHLANAMLKITGDLKHPAESYTK